MEQIGYLIRIARQELALLFGRDVDEEGSDPGNWNSGFVNITLRHRGLICGSMGASASNLPDAVRSALRASSRDERFGRVVLRGDIDHIDIELWIQVTRVQLSGDCLMWCKQLRLGRDGVRISMGASSAYYKPSVALTKSVSTVEELLGNLCRKANLPETAWKGPEACVERTEWIHAVEVPSGFVLLEGLRSLPIRRPEPPEILSAARFSLNRLLAIQKSDGTLGYIYNPFEDKWAEKTHWVRLAGCAYALARVADHSVANSESRMVQWAATRLLRSLLARTVSYGPNNLSIITEPNSDESWGKLGTIALTALASQYSVGQSFNHESDELIRSILELQNPDGSFNCGIGLKERASVQNFFPGESLLALAYYARRTRDYRASIAISRAFPYYKAHFHNQPSSAFVLWQADTWTRVASWLLENSFPSLGPKGPKIEELCGFVFDQADWLLSYQHTNKRGSPSEYLGGFNTPPTISSAGFVEGIIHALDAAKMIGDNERSCRYREAALLGMQFLLSLQVLPEIAPFFPRPELAVGATTKSLQSFEMRCDYDQHFLTACLTALESPNLWRQSSQEAPMSMRMDECMF